MIVLLSAGKATRLNGLNKLLATADGVPVHEWHRRAIQGRQPVSVVCKSDDEQSIKSEMPWVSSVVVHDRQNGPAGALAAFDREHPHSPVTVLFADSLLYTVPDVRGDWVGVAKAPTRVWDYYDRAVGWTRGEPTVLVCCGVYRFTDRHVLRSVLDSVVTAEKDASMSEVLRGYGAHVPLSELIITDWQDAGDLEALKRVKGKW